MTDVVPETAFLAFASAVLGRDVTLDSVYGTDWDSIGHFNLLMEIEARWDLKVPIERVPELKTLRDFYLLLPRRPAKVLALDADNTLWDGIVSEDGPDGIRPFADIQNRALALKRRGVMLVLLSKNDPPDGSSPVERALARADMPLSLADFAYAGVNWEPKPGNLLEAAKALNVAPESFVFVDDNPHERAMMRAHLPGVMTPDFPPEDLEGWFADAGRTREDALRADWRPIASTKPEYLRTLGLQASPGLAAEADVPRLAQMAGKTNQFNATTIRRTEADFRALLADPAKRVFTFRSSDRFGEMGLVCYVVCDVPSGRVTDFVMSCRAMGRTLECFAWRHVRRVLAEEGVALSAADVDFTPSAKNAPFAVFLDSLKSHADPATYYQEVPR